MKIYNTMSMQKEEFVPSGEYVTMYVCGITPQSEAQLTVGERKMTGGFENQRPLQHICIPKTFTKSLFLLLARF